MPNKRNSMNKSEILKGFNKNSANTLMETLDIEYIDVGEDFLTAKMRADHPELLNRCVMVHQNPHP